jgi:hypothetical protein
MSFWNDSHKTDGKFESGGGSPIPEDTTVMAAPIEVKWDEYQGKKHIKIQWAVLAPDQYKNRRIFQKVPVMDADNSKADKAKRMLAAIDANAGGHLMSKNEMPTDATLTQALLNKPMMLKLGLWEIDGKNGNWVKAVAPKGSAATPPAAPPPAANINEDDIPF